MQNQQNYYIVRKESGSVRRDLPVWAPVASNPFSLSSIHDDRNITRVEVPNVPGAFQLLNVFTTQEVKQIIDDIEQLGFTEDAAVSLPRSVRHNSNLNMVLDTKTLDVIWQRCQSNFVDHHQHFQGKRPLGINGRFRFYRYEEGDYFKMHTDGSWPGSRVINKELVDDSFGDRWSMYTFLILLNEDFVGGETQFLVNKDDPSLPAYHQEHAEISSVRTPAGSVLCFPHGTHPSHCLHGSAPISSGKKYIIRTDVLFEL